jgi:hypothetical protein
MRPSIDDKSKKTDKNDLLKIKIVEHAKKIEDNLNQSYKSNEVKRKNKEKKNSEQE